MPRFFAHSLAFIAVITCLVSCGGGSSSSSTTAGIDGSGAPATPITVAVAGPINGFGSVIINGVHYGTHNTTITVNGQPSSEAGLNVGSYITLTGTLNADGKTGTATHINYQPNVTGSIAQVNSVTQTVTILGQTVQVSDDTAFDFAISPRSIDGLKPGQQVEISGSSDASGVIMATRISLASAHSGCLTGKLSRLDTQAKTFQVNQVTVSYAGLSGAPELHDGEEIILRNFDTDGERLRAKSLEVKIEDQASTRVKYFSKTGVITRFTSPTDFALGDIPVTTTSATQYLNGDATGLALNAKATISGHFTADKRLQADQIQWLATAQWGLAGPITQIDGLTNSGGRIQVQDTWITLNARTRVDSELSTESNRLKFGNLRVGDQVVVSGRAEGAIYLAATLELEALTMPESPQHLRGPVTNIDAAALRFKLLNIQVTTDSKTEFFNGERRITAEEFYRVAANKIVIVDGKLMGNLCHATRVRFLSPSDDSDRGR